MVVLLLRVPQAAPEQPVPLKLQMTPALLTSLATVAARLRLVPSATVVLDGGVMVTPTGATVSVKVACSRELMTDVALIVTLKLLPDIVAGAVYCTVVDVALASEPQVTP